MPCPLLLAELQAKPSELDLSDALTELLNELNTSSLKEMKASLEAGQNQPLPSLGDTSSGVVRKALRFIYKKMDVKKEQLSSVINRLIEEKSGIKKKRREVRKEKKKVAWIKKRYQTEGTINSSPISYKDG